MSAQSLTHSRCAKYIIILDMDYMYVFAWASQNRTRTYDVSLITSWAKTWINLRKILLRKIGINSRRRITRGIQLLFLFLSLVATHFQVCGFTNRFSRIPSFFLCLCCRNRRRRHRRWQVQQQKLFFSFLTGKQQIGNLLPQILYFKECSGPQNVAT